MRKPTLLGKYFRLDHDFVATDKWQDPVTAVGYVTGDMFKVVQEIKLSGIHQLRIKFLDGAELLTEYKDIRECDEVPKLLGMLKFKDTYED